MQIKKLIESQGESLSFEFFPPKNREGEEQLLEAIGRLKLFKPTFVSVTYGAGGSTSEKTRDIVQRIKQETSLNVMPHLTCINQSRQEMTAILNEYRQLGVDNILALRGDPPREGEVRLNCYAKDLVELAASFDSFSIGVAVYPEGHLESPNLDVDMVYTKEKIDAGADFAITQMFFDNRYYYDFMERAERIGIHIPVIPGIMPITDLERIKRFSKICRASLPAALVSAMEKASSAEEVRKLGIDYAIRQCEDLRQNGVRYLHFYTLNRAETVAEILCNLSATKDSVACAVA